MAEVGQSAPTGGGAGAGGLATEHPAARGRVVVLNALPLNALPRRHMQLDVMPIGINDLASWVQRRLAEGFQLIHYIRHSATIQALRSTGIPLSEPSAGLYAYQPGDIIAVVTLRTPQRGQEQTLVSVNDLESWVVSVL